MGWSDDEDEQTLVIEDKFLRFNASGRGDFEVDEYEWGETTSWGYEMPQGKVTWLGPARPRLEEAQLAYVTVSRRMLSTCRSMADHSLVWQRAWDRHTIQSCYHAHPRPAFPRAAVWTKSPRVVVEGHQRGPFRH